MNQLRKIEKLIEPQLVIEGAGVLLKRSIAPRRSNEFDPFLLFDHFAFNDPTEGPIRGFPTHPHRGIKQFTDIDSAQYHLEISQRNHIGLAIRAIVRLEFHLLHSGIFWYKQKSVSFALLSVITLLILLSRFNQLCKF